MKRFDVLTIGLQVIDLMIPGMDGHILDREMTLLDHAELEVVKLMKTADGAPAETEYERDDV